MIKFITSTEKKIVDNISSELITSLKKYPKTLWLVSGGSNIPIEIKIANNLPSDLTSNLIVALIDERFGHINHPDSNLQQLIKAGLKLPLSTIIPVLGSDHNNLSETIHQYNKILSKLFSETNINIIGQLGIGEDGHIAGLLPNSEALTSNHLVDGYQSDTFTRITLTPLALKKLNQIFVIALNPNKTQAIEKLFNNSFDTYKNFPAGILRDFSNIYIYNRTIEGEVL